MKRLVALGFMLALAVCLWPRSRVLPQVQMSGVKSGTTSVHSVGVVLAARAPASVAAIPVSAPVVVNVDLNYFNDRLQALRACEVGGCGYPQSDPRSYEFARGQDLKKTLFSMADWVQTQHLEHASIAATAREFLHSSDGHVQEAALDLLATQPPSPENLNALLTDVLQGYDSQLIEQALLELERYPAAADVQKIDEALAQAVMAGDPMVAREVSTHLNPFLNAATLPFFKQLATSLSPDSVYRTNLETALTQYSAQEG